MVNDRKLQGSCAELAVAAKLMEFGWQVSFPFGESAPYDLICDSGTALTRIQVKSTNKPIANGTYKIIPRCGHGREYSKNDVDIIIAVLMTPTGHRFYVIPVEAVQTFPEITIYTSNRRCIITLYYENRWEFMLNMPRH